MVRYLQRRLLINLPILIAITAIIFTLLQLTPGDPLDAYLTPDQVLSEEQRASLRRELGLDQPAPIRYLYWLRSVASGNLGNRIRSGEPVLGVIGQKMGPTLMLMGSGLVVGMSAGLLLGILAAVKQYSFLDFLLTALAFLGTSTPAFFAALVGLYLFSLQLRLFPAGGFATPGIPVSALDIIHHLILPALLLSFFQIGVIMRYTRSALLGVLNQEYIRTARAKGLTSTQVVFGHALRNALLPVITIIGAGIPSLVGGAVFIESIFSWPGMGRLYLDSIEARDFPTIMGITLVLATITLTANLLTDLTYAAVDPRIRYE